VTSLSNALWTAKVEIDCIANALYVHGRLHKYLGIVGAKLDHEWTVGCARRQEVAAISCTPNKQIGVEHRRVADLTAVSPVDEIDRAKAALNYSRA
jgi:hypothetical protein